MICKTEQDWLVSEDFPPAVHTQSRCEKSFITESFLQLSILEENFNPSLTRRYTPAGDIAYYELSIFFQVN